MKYSRQLFEEGLERKLSDGTIVPKLKLKYRTYFFSRFKSKSENGKKQTHTIYWHLQNRQPKRGKSTKI